jgi:oxygen-independent coproporphyrinogen-3 oxidase
MCDFSVNVGQVCRAHGWDAGALLASLPRLRTLMLDGLIQRDGDVLSIPAEARALVRNVAAAFDAHLGTTAAIHSRAA